MIYVALWVLLVREGESVSIGSRIVSDRRELQLVVVISTAVLALLIALEALGLHASGSIAWPLMLSAVGALTVWRGASPSERNHLNELADKAPLIGATAPVRWRTIVVRAVVGLVLVLAGVRMLARVGSQSGPAAGAFFGAVFVAVGFFVLFAPWWLRTVRELARERTERVRAQERADLAAHLHDSVLQTLSLIQRAAHDPVEVARLARIQERELRSWLFDPRRGAPRAGAPATVAEATGAVQREVEDSYGVAVELVVVGDCPLDDCTTSLVAAGRESMVNAAKWSGAASIAVYLEVEPERISLFVRDLGCGFDLDAVPDDRKGISGSIVERMARIGGAASLRTAPGVGTEVELVLPRRRDRA